MTKWKNPNSLGPSIEPSLFLTSLTLNWEKTREDFEISLSIYQLFIISSYNFFLKVAASMPLKVQWGKVLCYQNSSFASYLTHAKFAQKRFFYYLNLVLRWLVFFKSKEEKIVSWYRIQACQVLNSIYFLHTLSKAWLETPCPIVRSLCGPQLLLTHVTLGSVFLHAPWLILPSKLSYFHPSCHCSCLFRVLPLYSLSFSMCPFAWSQCLAETLLFSAVWWKVRHQSSLVQSTDSRTSSYKA